MEDKPVNADAVDEVFDTEFGPTPGIRVTCRKCGHVVEAMGDPEMTGPECMELLMAECPRGETNLYNIWWIDLSSLV
jgi:hypothetical protein